MNTSMDILGVKYEFSPSVFYLFGPLVKNSVLRIRSTVPARLSHHGWILVRIVWQREKFESPTLDWLKQQFKGSKYPRPACYTKKFKIISTCRTIDL